MPHNIGEMFYTGDIPWHGLGMPLAAPATIEEALKAGGLKWRVGEEELLTASDPPTYVGKRKALVRLDRPAGDESRVLGVVHRGFNPLQNEEGAMLFDAIVGQGRPVYHTGGYLGRGEVIWLMAGLKGRFNVRGNDEVDPYVLFTNSHDGSLAIDIRLTLVRVVCQNTLNVALGDKTFGASFRRAHQGTLRDHARAAQEFFDSTTSCIGRIKDSFTSLSTKPCTMEQFERVLEALLPLPKKPARADNNPGLLKAYETKTQRIQAARAKIRELRVSGRGLQMDGAAGTFWGALNAITEFIDHHQPGKQAQLGYSLLGDGMDLKTKAYRLLTDVANAA